ASKLVLNSWLLNRLPCAVTKVVTVADNLGIGRACSCREAVTPVANFLRLEAFTLIDWLWRLRWFWRLYRSSWNWIATARLDRAMEFTVLEEDVQLSFQLV